MSDIGQNKQSAENAAFTWKDGLDLFAKMLLPVVLAVSACEFHDQKQTNDDIELITEMITSEDHRKRRVGTVLLKEYSARLPPKYINTINEYSLIAETVEEGRELSFAISGVDGIEVDKKSIPIRIYFHISSNKSRDAAKLIEEKLRNISINGEEIIVPGIEAKSGPATNELRCFKALECQKYAEDLIAALKKSGVGSIELKDLSRRYENAAGIRPKHFEVWFAPDGLGG